MTPFNSGNSSPNLSFQELNTTVLELQELNSEKHFNSEIKFRKAQGSTMIAFQPLDHVQINPHHTIKFGRWQSMPIFPTNEILNHKTIKPQLLLHLRHLFFS